MTQASKPYPRVRVSIDRGGTFTDVFAEILRTPGGRVEQHVSKLLSEDPASYDDAPTEAIRRVLTFAGVSVEPAPTLVPTEHLDEVRMGTTVATNALLERNGARTALVTTQGLRDVLRIGRQARPDIFDISAARPAPLYEAVVEAKERVIVSSRDAADAGAVQLAVEKPLDVRALRVELEKLRADGVTSLAVVFMHAYSHSEHEQQAVRVAKELGFDHVSASGVVTPMVKIVSRGLTTVVDAYLTPKIREYLSNFCSGFENQLEGVRVMLMKSDGGLCGMKNFSGSLAILSGPAGGVVGYAKTAYAYSAQEALDAARKAGLPDPDTTDIPPVIGFDMGGTSTDCSRYDGKLEHVFETQIAGSTIQAVQLDITTVAAGGGSRLFYRGGLFAVGPESAGAHPGPVCYRKNGHLAVTDANLLLGRIQPEMFPNIFGENRDEPLDAEATRKAFEALTASINEQVRSRDVLANEMTPEEVALGFVRVANEAMCRPIRQLTEAKGHDVRNHVLACFGGAGGQHACAIARSLGIKKVFVHRYSGILSAFGIALADLVAERQHPWGASYSTSLPRALVSLEQAAEEATEELVGQGFSKENVRVEKYLNLRYDGTSVGIIVDSESARRSSPTSTNSITEDYGRAFVERYQDENGFTIPNRTIIIDDIRVRASAQSKAASALTSTAGPSHHVNSDQSTEAKSIKPVTEVRTYFHESNGFVSTGVYRLEDMASESGKGTCVTGPAIVIDKDATIIVEPACTAKVTSPGDLVIDVEVDGASRRMASLNEIAVPDAIDRVKLSIFGHRFMGIAEQMGRTLQRTAISTNIKERLDFSCALFDPTGGLVANAPHIPVHLGSMQDAVRYQSQLLGDSWKQDDVLLCNHPVAGGTHLPDVTVISPVYYDGELAFYVASRGHQADIGGIAPGSMPPFSRRLADEGMAVESMKIVTNGLFQEEELLRRLSEAGGRCNPDVVSDIRAQVSANKKGSSLVMDLIRTEGIRTVHAYMYHIQTAAADAVRDLLRKASVDNGLDDVGVLSASDYMDDGTKICLDLSIDRQAGTAVFDFTGTGKAVVGNTNAPRAITSSAVIYTLRCLVAESIPMNQGCLDPVKIVLPEGSILNPGIDSAVAGGNVLTSQRITDVILRAFGACGASQGCMGNFTFGNDKMGYYETIGGGSGAGPGWHGTSGVQCHMTNTMSTDSEIFERRYPGIVREFRLRHKSGGSGKWKGGEGIVRHIEFTAPVTASILSERRVYVPWGMKGGGDAERGSNALIREDGTETNLTGKNTLDVFPGDSIVIRTPGGGGYGSPECAPNSPGVQ